MPLSRHGIREWGLATIIAIAVTIPLVVFGLFWWLAPIWLAWLAIASFFRDPPRRPPAELDPDDMLSPADGTISAIERIEHHEATDGPALVIRIFLSVLNVHINRAPCDGRVVRMVHRPGKYLDARTTESARVNESNLIVIERPNGEWIGVRQVSGAIARRIVCPLQEGQSLERGERIGLIKFGSTTELILPRPDEIEVIVKRGDKVRGAKTRLGRAPASRGR